MKYFRWAIAWVLYWIGDLVSKMDRIDWEWLANIWYPVYNRCMYWSSNIQGSGHFGPWHKTPSQRSEANE